MNGNNKMLTTFFIMEKSYVLEIRSKHESKAGQSNNYDTNFDKCVFAKFAEETRFFRVTSKTCQLFF